MRWRILVSLMSLAIICFGVGYALGRERLRDPDHLHALYQQTNKEFFDSELRDVDLKSYNLTDYDAEGITMQHEACHVATWEEGEPDPHGPKFQECMKRFEKK
jgi:hypothetical protein